MCSPAATALPRSERSAESTPAPSLQASNSSSLCGNIPVLLHQQGRDGRDGRDGLQGPVGPSGMKGEKGDQGIQLQGADGQQGPVGPSGRKGEKGDQGIQLQGPPGLQGRYIVLSYFSWGACSYGSSHKAHAHTAMYRMRSTYVSPKKIIISAM